MPCKSVHLFFLYELAPVGLRQSFPGSGTETGIFLQQPYGGVFHKRLGIGSVMGRDLRKLRFLFRREMHFHTKNPFFSA